ncbi:MAG: protein kinase [Acidobacteriota bacterium]
MTPERHRLLTELLEELLALSPDERSTRLDRHRDDDPELVERAEALLRHERGDEDDDLLDSLGGWSRDLLAARLSHEEGVRLPERLGRYLLREELGRGAFGVVHRAHDEQLNRDLALKISDPDLALVDEWHARFVREAELLAKLVHPNVAAIHDLGRDETTGRVFLAMQHVEGVTLRDHLKAHGPLSVSETRELGLQLASAMTAAQERQVVHCDLKPENLMLTHDARGRAWLTILDFGLARVLYGLSGSSPRGGTPSYMSPELWDLDRAVDHRSDLWSCGVVLFECLTGQRPFTGDGDALRRAIETSEPPWHLLPDDVPESLEGLLRHCLAKSPARRLDSFLELGRMLETLPTESPPPRPRSGRRLLVVALTSLVVMTSALGLGARWREQQRESTVERLLQQAEVALEDDDAQLAALLAREARLVSPDDSVSEQLARALVRVSSTPRVVLDGHEGPLRMGAWHPDGDRIVTVSRDGTAIVWSRDGRRLTTLAGGGGEVYFATWNPSGTQLVTTSADGKARAWDDDGRLLATLDGRHADRLHHGAFSPDGSRLVTVAYDGGSNLWDAERHVLVRSLERRPGRIFRIEWSPDGTRFVTAGDDGAWTWSRDGLPLLHLDDHERAVLLASWDPRGELLVTTSEDGSARLWDNEGRLLRVMDDHDGKVTWADWSPDGERIATSSSDHSARTWRRDGSAEHHLVGHEDELWHLSWSPDGSRLATFSNDGTARTWDRHGSGLTVLRGHRDAVHGSDWSPDGRSLLTVSADGTALAWSPALGESTILTSSSSLIHVGEWMADGTGILTWSRNGRVRLHDVEGRERLVLDHVGLRACALHPAGDRIATSSSDGSTRIWGPTGRLLHELTTTDPISALSWSPVGDLLLTRSANEVATWTATGRRRHGFPGHQARLGGVLWSPDGRRVLTLDGSLARIWTSSGEPLGLLRGHDGRAHAAAWHPTEPQVATAGQDGTVITWEVTTGSQLRRLVHSDPVRALAWSPDGELLATASHDTVRLWPRGDASLHVLTGHADRVSAVAWSPDGRRLLTTSHDGTSRTWDREGRLLSVHAEHAAAVRGGAWSPDGERVVTWAHDHVARLWTPSPIWEQVETLVDRDLSDEECARYELPCAER